MLSPITKLLLPLALGCALSVAVMVFSERSHTRLNQANQLIASSIETQAVASEILALVSEAETAQRGFLLTQRPEYLEPYVTAVPKIGPKLQRLKDLNTDNPEQRAQVNQLAKLIGEKLAELDASLRLYKEKGPKQAQELIETDVGRRTMNEVRKQIDAIQNAERAELIARSSTLERRRCILAGRHCSNHTVQSAARHHRLYSGAARNGPARADPAHARRAGP